MTVAGTDAPVSPLARARLRPRLPRLARADVALAVLGIAVLGVLALAAFGPAVYPASSIQPDLIARLQPPSRQHLLGTDGLGRDVFAQIVRGARWSITVGGLATVLGALVGTPVGMVSGWFRGPVETALMRMVDTAIAFPFMVLAVAVIAILQPGFWPLVVTLALGSWVVFARAAYAETRQLAARSFVEAARALGGGSPRVLLRHIWPSMRAAIVVIASFTFADLVIAESGLSFLGLGAPPSVTSWGVMLADGRGYMQTAWWLTVAPGGAIALSVIVANLFGDALERALGPRR